MIAATTISQEDSRICDIAEKDNVFLFRGDEENVFLRLAKAAKEFELDQAIRICSDGQFLSLMDQMMIKAESISSKPDNLAKSFRRNSWITNPLWHTNMPIMQTKQNSKSHWNQIYRIKKVAQLGWYELNPQPSLDLIRQYLPEIESRILHVGAGATTLVDELLKLGYSQQIVNDISFEALARLKQRLGELSKQVIWVEDDIINARILPELPAVDLWHDRAVLHFFTEADGQASYFSLLHRLVKPGGFVILATFHLTGATMCSGLPVQRYDAAMLGTKLGADFSLIKTFQYTYTMPSGDTREYVYALFQRENMSTQKLK